MRSAKNAGDELVGAALEFLYKNGGTANLDEMYEALGKKHSLKSGVYGNRNAKLRWHQTINLLTKNHKSADLITKNGKTWTLTEAGWAVLDRSSTGIEFLIIATFIAFVLATAIYYWGSSVFWLGANSPNPSKMIGSFEQGTLGCLVSLHIIQALVTHKKAVYDKSKNRFSSWIFKIPRPLKQPLLQLWFSALIGVVWAMFVSSYEAANEMHDLIREPISELGKELHDNVESFKRAPLFSNRLNNAVKLLTVLGMRYSQDMWGPSEPEYDNFCIQYQDDIDVVLKHCLNRESSVWHDWQTWPKTEDAVKILGNLYLPMSHSSYLVWEEKTKSGWGDLVEKAVMASTGHSEIEDLLEYRRLQLARSFAIIRKPREGIIRPDGSKGVDISEEERIYSQAQTIALDVQSKFHDKLEKLDEANSFRMAALCAYGDSKAGLKIDEITQKPKYMLRRKYLDKAKEICVEEHKSLYGLTKPAMLARLYAQCLAMEGEGRNADYNPKSEPESGWEIYNPFDAIDANLFAYFIFGGNIPSDYKTFVNVGSLKSIFHVGTPSDWIGVEPRANERLMFQCLDTLISNVHVAEQAITSRTTDDRSKAWMQNLSEQRKVLDYVRSTLWAAVHTKSLWANRERKVHWLLGYAELSYQLGEVTDFDKATVELARLAHDLLPGPAFGLLVGYATEHSTQYKLDFDSNKYVRGVQFAESNFNEGIKTSRKDMYRALRLGGTYDRDPLWAPK